MYTTINANINFTSNIHLLSKQSWKNYNNLKNNLRKTEYYNKIYFDENNTLDEETAAKRIQKCYRDFKVLHF